MASRKFLINIQNIYYYFIALLALILSVYEVFNITGFQMDYLSYLLYDKSHLSAVHRLLSQFVIRKLLFDVLFFLLALVMLYLFYFSFFQLIYLKLSIVCFLEIIYCTTLTETNTIFYIGSKQGRFWQNSGLISCIFLILFLLYLVFEPVLEKCSFLVILASSSFYIIVSVVMIYHRYSQNIRMIPFLFLSFLGFLFLLTVLALKSHDFKTLFSSLPVAGCIFYLFYSNYIGRIHNYNINALNHHAAFYDASIYVSVFATIYLLAATIIHKRNFLMHSRELNQKINELESSRYLLLGVLYSNVKNYLFSAQTALDFLQNQSDLSSTSQRASIQLQNELSNIGTLYNQIHNYTIFSGNSMNLKQCHVNMDIFFHLFAQKLTHAELLLSQDTVHFVKSNCYSDIFPEYLLQFLEDLIILLRQQNPSGHLVLQTKTNQLSFSFSLNYSYKYTMPSNKKKRFYLLLHPEYNFVPDLTSIDYVLSILRFQIKKCGGNVSISANRDFCLQITFPISPTGMLPYSQITYYCQCEDKIKRKHILFITSDEHQAAQIKKMLPFDQYHFTIANDAEYFIEHIQELGTYSLLIVGNLYRNTYFHDFYTCIRKQYPMTTLPILMLLPDLYAENSFYIRSTINDYLIPPYSQVSLEKKIHSLVTMKRTADLILETQLEFWQSQINPHFIFNSINSIMQMCIKEPLKAYTLLENFSEYLRGHLTSQSLNHVSTIQKEINLISAYLQIEKARFGDKIRYELDIDCAEDFPILPLLIEPLIENSIKHSALYKSSVTISVQIFQMEEQLLIRVEDDGKGMSDEIIQKILTNTFESNSIGLSNVCSRLRHYYHTIPLIESTLNKGTTIQFTIGRKIMQKEEFK